jgi:hypothetical protein
MKSKKYFKISDKLMNSIIATAYGDAGFFERLKIYILAGKSPGVKDLLYEYRETAKNVHSIKPDECPDEVLNKIKSISEFENKPSSFLFDIYAALFTRPAISAIAAVVITAVLVLSVSLNQGSFNGYTSAEIEQANRQTRQALAIVSSIFSKTEESIKKDILIDKVSKPLNNGVTTVNNLFIEKEKKNEN